MSKLNFVADLDELNKYRATVWEMEVGEGRVPGLKTYTSLPCFVKAIPIRYAFNLEAVGMFMTVCSKNEAKKIIYPKTNKNRGRLGGFTVIEGNNLKDQMKAYITRSIERAKNQQNIDTTYPVQRLIIERAMLDLGEVKGLALVSYKTYISLDRLRLINFYTVDEADARKLVYYGKRPKRDVVFEEFVRGYKKSFFEVG
jgi:hypothetical protein